MYYIVANRNFKKLTTIKQNFNKTYIILLK